jgi:PPK2 family polyphosphate:nucleotide phosphotransferase
VGRAEAICYNLVDPRPRRTAMAPRSDNAPESLAAPSRYQVPFDGSFRISAAPTSPGGEPPGKKVARKELDDLVDEVRDLQRRFHAQDSTALLLVFQAMDAAGKDGTIRAVMSGVNPAGVQVFSFKKPSAEELDHDFLWRTARCLPERGRIGVFNRSYYEEVLVVRVHPEFLGGQRLPRRPPLDELWGQRFDSIRDHERHLARNGTVILKFFLNVSREEQRRRLVRRIDDPDRNWKFNKQDIVERRYWDSYMAAYEDALNATSRPWAPWYAIPADDKPSMRIAVARIVADTMKAIDPRYPAVSAEQRDDLQLLRDEIMEEG